MKANCAASAQHIIFIVERKIRILNKIVRHTPQGTNFPAGKLCSFRVVLITFFCFGRDRLDSWFKLVKTKRSPDFWYYVSILWSPMDSYGFLCARARRRAREKECSLWEWDMKRYTPTSVHVYLCTMDRSARVEKNVGCKYWTANAEHDWGIDIKFAFVFLCMQLGWCKSVICINTPSSEW